MLSLLNITVFLTTTLFIIECVTALAIIQNIHFILQYYTLFSSLN